MTETLTKVVDAFSDIVRIFILVLLSVCFTGVGVTLAMGGRFESVIPLLLGAGALSQLPKAFINLYRDLTGNY